MSKDTYGNPDTPTTATAIDTIYGAAVVDRVIPVYPDTTARDAAIASPNEGQFVFLTGDDYLQVYDGAAWHTLARVDGPDTDASSSSGTDNTTSYTELGPAGSWGFSSEVEVTLETGSVALVLFKAQLSSATAGALTYLSFSVSGASAVAASNDNAALYESSNASDRALFASYALVTGLTPGSNTFTLEAKTNGASCTVALPEISVIPQ